MVRRCNMESRIDTFWKECRKAQKNMQDLLQEAKGFITEVEESERQDRRDKYLSCMQRLDEFTYTVLEFNLALEKFDLPSNSRLEETSNALQKSSKKPLNIGSFYGILEPIPSNVSDLSNPTSMFKKHKICPPDQLIDLDSSSSISAENLNMFGPELTTNSTLIIPKSESTTQHSEDCNVVSEMELTSMVAQKNENNLLSDVIKNEDINNAKVLTITDKDNVIIHQKIYVKAEKLDEDAATERTRSSNQHLDTRTDPKRNFSIGENVTKTKSEKNKIDCVIKANCENIITKSIKKTNCDMDERKKNSSGGNVEINCSENKDLTIAEEVLNSINDQLKTVKLSTKENKNIAEKMGDKITDSVANIDITEKIANSNIADNVPNTDISGNVTDAKENNYLAVKGHNGIEIQGINSHAVNTNLEEIRKRSHASFIKTINTASPTEARTKAGVLPDQARLKLNEPYFCCILHIESPDLFYICVGNMDEINECHEQMLVYYSSLASFPSKDAIASLCLNYCACRIQSSSWYRAFVINFDFSPGELEVYLLDVGKKYVVHYSDVQPLTTEFTKLPAYARECYLVGLDPMNIDGAWSPLARDLMQEYSSNTCTVYVQEEINMTMGVLLLRNKILINKQLIDKNLALAGNDCHHLFALEGVDIPEYDSDENEIMPEKPADQMKVELDEMGAELESDNVLEAVTGYANRDEAEICKHYRGPPDTTCFKQSRCKKRHVQIHPEGWTLDKKPIIFQPIRNQELIMPGSTISVYVSHVASYNVVFVMLRSEESPKVPTPRIDSLALPQTLESLHAHMNSVYARRTYRPLLLPPALHELVAAPYSDGCWYRARVTDTHLDGNHVEVQYMDYGNRSWVKVSELCQLDESFCVLPTQAYRCRLAGVSPTCDVYAVDQGYKLLQKLSLGYYFSALVVSTSNSDMEVALFDKDGKEVAFTMAESGVVTFAPYTITEEIIQVIPG